MKEKRSHLYEGMYIINATLSEDAKNKAIERITSGIQERGGEIHKTFDQGTKKLAYEINGTRQGHYFILYFSMPSEATKEIWSDYHLNEDLIRYMTLRAEEVAEKVEFTPAV